MKEQVGKKFGNLQAEEKRGERLEPKPNKIRKG